jgi:uncharacterized protein YlzI (FlbEa/FlbD family)
MAHNTVIKTKSGQKYICDDSYDSVVTTIKYNKEKFVEFIFADDLSNFAIRTDEIEVVKQY